MSTLRDSSDAELFSRWARGEDAAALLLADRHWTPLRNYFRRRISHGDEDLVQQVFAIALQRSRAVRLESSFRAFLFGIARNLLLQSYRAEAVARRVPVSPTPEPVSSPSVILRRTEQVHQLHDALQTLPDDLRQTVELYYWERLATAEIGTVLGVAAGTVKWRLAVARGMLRRYMDGLSGQCRQRA